MINRVWSLQLRHNFIVNIEGYTDITLHFVSTQISLVFAYKSGEIVLYYTSGK